MRTPKRVSVVSATFNRGALLDRALATYAQQDLPFSEWEYLIVDDGSTDDTREVVAKWQAKGLPLILLDAAVDLGRPKEPGVWRDGCGIRNAATTHAVGAILVSTHPEILIPHDALRVMAETVEAHPESWVTAIPYWLPPNAETMCARLAMEPGALRLDELRHVEGFYDPSWPGPIEAPGAPDYRNQNEETRTDWESEVFWAMRMGLWRWMGGFREFTVWGSVDMDFLGRRHAARIPTVVARSPATPAPSGVLMVYHQHHDSPRKMEDAMAAITGANHADYSTVESMRKYGGLYGVYQHGPRERMIFGPDDVLLDHRLRYEWAVQVYTEAGYEGPVVDAPCGTGYGSAVFPHRVPYLGVDLDAESIGWARVNHGHAYATFVPANMAKLPVIGRSIDLIASFEGLEHTEDQAETLVEFWRALRPGGRLLLSTPQKGVANGTPWDRYMLTAPELEALFREHEDHWSRITYYHQRHYGGPWPVTLGQNLQAEIMLVEAIKA